MSVNTGQVKTNSVLYSSNVKKPVQFTVPGLLPAPFLYYIFHIKLHSDLYSN